MKAKLITENGVRKVEVNGEVIEPVSFRSFWPAPQTTKMFGDGGVRMMTVFPSGILCSLGVPYSQFGEYWLGEGVYDWDVLRRQMDQFIANAPNAYLELMLMLDTRDWYLKENPDAVDSFSYIRGMAGDKKWRESGARMIRDTLDFLNREYPEKIFCVFVCAGGTCEWYTRDHKREIPAVEARCWREYRAACGLPEAPVPPRERIGVPENGSLCDPIKERDTVDYMRFRHESVCDALLYFAHTVKEHTHGDLLVGCFFGYFVNHMSPNANYYEFARILRSPDVDWIFSPASYTYRGLESVSSEMVPIDSVRLHDKIFFHEIDNTTYYANENEFAKKLQSYAHRRHSSPYETVMYSRRESSLVMAKLGAHWWFDMFGGWYDNDDMMAELMKIRRANAELYSKPVKVVSEVAVFLDGESAYYAGGTLTNILNAQREALGMMGCPVDFYVADDLLRGDFPHDRVKLYIFPNLFAPSTVLSAKILELRERGASMLFYHAAGLVTPTGFSVKAASVLTGIRLAESDITPGQITVPAGEWTDGESFLYGQKATDTRPNLKAIGFGAELIGRDIVKGDGLLAVKRRPQGGFDAWTRMTSLPAELLRAIARRAGVFIYSEDKLPLYANDRMVSVFSHTGGEYTLRVPKGEGELVEMYTGECHAIVPGGVKLTFAENECKCFFIN